MISYLMNSHIFCSDDLRKRLVSDFSETKCIQLPKEKIADGTLSSIIELKVSGSEEEVVGKVFKINPLNTQVLLKKVQEIIGEIKCFCNLDNDNIVGIKGICFIPDRIMPVLLMERMTKSLQSYTHHHQPPSLSVETKIKILRDTANGLNYLHSLDPPFIHGRFTTECVLLHDVMHDTKMTAKIGGFNIKSLPQTPVAAEYMPPEAQGGSESSDCSLDVFSFGHLALVTILQEEIRPPTPSQSFNEAGELRIVDEVERRAGYLKRAQTVLDTETGLLDTIKECLKNNPKQRICTEKLMKVLQSRLIIFLCLVLFIICSIR